MQIVYCFFIIILNYSIYKLLKNNYSIRYHILVIVLLYASSFILTKIHSFIPIHGIMESYSLHLLQFFSLTIPLTNFMYWNLNIFKEDLHENLYRDKKDSLSSYYEYFNFITFLTFFVTLGQLFFILSGASYTFKN
jgi:predicted tellurium resistance membrane protein TerC